MGCYIPVACDGCDKAPSIGENGNWWLGNEDTGIKAKGEPGISPTIGSNGNWFIGDVDTGVNASGAPAPSEAKWASLQVGKVTVSANNQLIHFNRTESKTNMQINAAGNLIVPSGVYMMGMNFCVHSEDNAGAKYFNGSFYNVADEEWFGEECARLLNMSAVATASDCNFIWKFEKETEICLTGATTVSYPIVLSAMYGYIFEIGKR